MKNLYYEIINKMEKIGDSYSDVEIYEDLRKFSLEISGTNCEVAAELLFSLIASICSLRESPLQMLIRSAIRHLFYIGYETKEEIYRWIFEFCKNKKLDFLEIQPTLKGRKWLENEFLAKEELIVQTLNELEAVNKIYNILNSILIDKNIKKVKLNYEKNERTYNKEFISMEEFICFLDTCLKNEYEKISNSNAVDFILIIKEELEGMKNQFENIGWKLF